MHIDDGSGAPMAGGETTWENTRRFSGRVMVAGLACFLLMLPVFVLGLAIDQGQASGWIDLGKIIGVAGLVVFKVGFWTRRHAPHDPEYNAAVERFVTLASTLQAELRDAIARHDPAYPNAERALRNVERWIGAANAGTLPPGTRNGLGIEKSGLEFGAADKTMRALEAAYVAIPRS